MLKGSRHHNIFIFIISQDYYELPKRTNRAKGIFYHIFKPNSFRDVQKLNQDKVSMNMTLNEFTFLTASCGIQKYQHRTVDITKDKYIRRYRLGLNSLFVPHSSPF